MYTKPRACAEDYNNIIIAGRSLVTRRYQIRGNGRQATSTHTCTDISKMAQARR